MSHSIQAVDLTELEGEPRVLDLRVAEALEFERPRDIRQLIERNREELERYGSLRYHTANPGSAGGRPSTEYWLNELQCIAICQRSETPKAIEVRVEITKVFHAWRHGRLHPVATLNPTDIIGAMFRRELVPVRQDIANLDTKVARIDANVVFLSNRVDDIVPRREFAKWIRVQWYRVTLKFYNGECPCCRDVSIVRDDLSAMDELNLDHFRGRELNGVEDGWPVCRRCNHRLRTDAEFKVSRRSHFEVFQDHRRNLFGREGKALRVGAEQMEFKI